MQYVFYAVTGYKFRPMSANPCVRAAQNEPLLRHCGQPFANSRGACDHSATLCTHPLPTRCVRCFAPQVSKDIREDEEELRQLEMEQIAMKMARTFGAGWLAPVCASRQAAAHCCKGA